MLLSRIIVFSLASFASFAVKLFFFLGVLRSEAFYGQKEMADGEAVG
jgi:hypothetical protein